MTSTVTFSALLRTPKEVVARLDEGDVLLTRRDAEPLRLSKAHVAEQEGQALDALAHLIAASLDEGVVERIVEHLTEPFPWLVFLPDRVRADFVGEFLTTARACASTGHHFERLMIVLNAWKATAEAYATPHLTATGDDLDYLDEAEIVPNPRNAP